MGRAAQRGAEERGRASRPPTNADIEVTDPDLLLRLVGPGGEHLRLLEREFDVDLGLRGDTLHLQGPADEVAAVERAVAELLDVLGERHMAPMEIVRAARMLRDHPDLRLRELFDDVVLVTSQRKVVTPKGVAQQAYVRAIEQHPLVFGVGPAGTGKTYLAMACAVRALQRREVQRIILTRPAVEAGEKLGFLPGDLAEKVNPYLRPLYDALHDMMDMDKAQSLIHRGVIEVAPLAFMRGRTLNDCFVILDEAQNTTPEQMKMFLTRLGFDSRAVVTGDVTQVDLPEGRPSGLSDAMELLQGVEGIGFVFFSDQDVVRHPLVARIVRAYERRETARRRAAATGAAASGTSEPTPADDEDDAADRTEG